MPRNRRGRSDARAASRDEAILGEAGAANEVYGSPFHKAAVDDPLAVKPDPHGALNLCEHDVEDAEELGGRGVGRVVELLAGEDGRGGFRIRFRVRHVRLRFRHDRALGRCWGWGWGTLRWRRCRCTLGRGRVRSGRAFGRCRQWCRSALRWSRIRRRGTLGWRGRGADEDESDQEGEDERDVLDKHLRRRRQAWERHAGGRSREEEGEKGEIKKATLENLVKPGSEDISRKFEG